MRREILTRFNTFLTLTHTIIGKAFSPNFNYISHTLTDIFSKKSTIGTGSTYSLPRSLNSLGSICTIFRHKVAHFSGSIRAKVYFDIFY